MSVATPPASAASSQDSSRRLSQPGDSGAPATISRTTMAA